jgi:hypothetical protein
MLPAVGDNVHVLANHLAKNPVCNDWFSSINELDAEDICQRLSKYGAVCTHTLLGMLLWCFY